MVLNWRRPGEVLVSSEQLVVRVYVGTMNGVAVAR